MPKPYASTVVDASAADVWAYVRDFTNIAEWLPTIESCEIEGDGDPRIGCVRKLAGPGGAVFRERLLALSDVDRSCTYEFTESPFPVRSYRATLRVAPVTDSGKAFVEWWAWYDADAKDEESMTKIFGKAIFATGLESLRGRFAEAAG